MSEFIPENDLERALVQAAADPANWGTFYRLLLDAELFVLGFVDNGAGASAITGSQTKIQIAQIQFKDRIYHPVFSAVARLQGYSQEHPQYFSMKGRELFASARGAFFLLNPGSDYVKELLPEEITDMLQWENDQRKNQQPGQVLISQPAVFPAALADVLRKLFATRPEIEAAYLGQMAFAGKNEPPHPIVGIKLRGEWEPVAQEIERVVAPLPQGTRLAAIPITDEGPRKVIGEALMRYVPIYARNTKLH